MKVPVVTALCTAILGASVAVAAETVPTITIYTEPPELEIWADGEYLGVGEAVLFGPFEDYVEVTVKGKGLYSVETVDPPTDEGEHAIVIITGEPSDFNVFSLLEGVGAGFLMALLGTYALASIAD